METVVLDRNKLRTDVEAATACQSQLSSQNAVLAASLAKETERAEAATAGKERLAQDLESVQQQVTAVMEAVHAGKQAHAAVLGANTHRSGS